MHGFTLCLCHASYCFTHAYIRNIDEWRVWDDRILHELFVSEITLSVPASMPGERSVASALIRFCGPSAAIPVGASLRRKDGEPILGFEFQRHGANVT
jgi:hypothetical protein